MRWVKRIGVFLAAAIGIAIAAALAFYLYLRQSVPTYSGEARLTGLSAPVEIVLAGESRPDDYALEPIVARHYLPWAVQIPIRSAAARASLARLPWLQQMRAPEGREAVFICREFVCQAPMTEAEPLYRELDEMASPLRIL